jgi:hypothetical protein
MHAYILIYTYTLPCCLQPRKLLSRRSVCVRSHVWVASQWYFWFAAMNVSEVVCCFQVSPTTGLATMHLMRFYHEFAPDFQTEVGLSITLANISKKMLWANCVCICIYGLCMCIYACLPASICAYDSVCIHLLAYIWVHACFAILCVLRACEPRRCDSACICMYVHVCVPLNKHCTSERTHSVLKYMSTYIHTYMPDQGMPNYGISLVCISKKKQFHENMPSSSEYSRNAKHINS